MAKDGKKQKRSYIITGIIAGVVVALLVVGAFFSDRVTSNPPGTIGNTAGNLNNAGLFCEYNDTVYFSNPLDNGTLYAMNPDETNIRKLNSMQVRNILAGGDYLYYFQLKSGDTTGFGTVANTHAFNRCNLKGEQAVTITRDVVVSGQLIDDYLYLLTAGKTQPSFYKIKTDKTNKTELANYSINPASVSNGIIYYNGTQDNHALYRLNTANDVAEEIWAGNLWNPVINGDYIYYMDLVSDYKLCRYSLSTQTSEVLTHDRVDCFNVGSGYIYYQTNDATNPQLKCMHTDGSNVITVANGIFSNINMTSQYVYFQEFDVEASLYHCRLGSDRATLFSMDNQ
ncbi:MAG: DUF5050 domain-containing protein [Lachnospiraceae bacterium]|nr:DUF5050 domain-containing protein [Lachnospiraceae bacterium]